jgi:hypothetical protein
MDKQQVVNQISEHVRAALNEYALAMQSQTSDVSKTALAIWLIGVPEALNDLLDNLQAVAVGIAEPVEVLVP